MVARHAWMHALGLFHRSGTAPLSRCYPVVMTAPARRAATYEDLCALPDTVVAEIIAGDLYASPRPSVPHALASSTLGGDLSGPFQRGRGGPGGWWILFEPELHLGDDVVVPDLAGWRRARMSRPPRGPYITLAPDWVCEVLSPATARLDRVAKMPLYAREGVGHLWLIEPLAKTLEVYRLRGAHWVVLGSYGGAARVRAEPFEAVEIALAALWGEEGEE